MGIIYNFKCDKCGCETYLEAENEFQKVLICENCAECYVVEQRKENHQSNTPKCPTCGSTNIEKIGGMERAGSIAMWGIFSKKINKTFKCKKCGYTW